MKDPLWWFGGRACVDCTHARVHHSAKGGCLFQSCACQTPRRRLSAFGLRQSHGQVVNGQVVAK